MVRVTRGNVAAKRRKKYIKLAKGYVGSNSRLSTLATEQVIQSLNFAYIGRKLRKRNFRLLWISRINSISRLCNTTYSNFLGGLRKLNIFLNKKILAEIAFNDLPGFLILQFLIKNIYI